MNQNQSTSRIPKAAKLKAVDRIMTLPVVESGWNYAGQVYGRLKESSNVLHWAFGQAELSFSIVATTTSPAVWLLQGPISTLDKIVCQSLDTVEQKLPSINLPPEMLYSNTKQYVADISTRIVHPILKRADSVKQIGTSVLESKYTEFAADTLEGALNVADKYLDKYLPADVPDANIKDRDASRVPEGPARKAYKTIHHMDQFSRKLQRGLTQRTLAEAKAFKAHSAEAMHVLVYIIELVANDPKTAYYKSQELWSTLSNDEPENQARPQDLEQLIMMLTRESARRMVHLVNFTSKLVTTLPSQMRILTYTCLQTIDELAKAGHFDNMNQTIFELARIQAHRFTLLLYHLNLYTTDKLQHVAQSLEQQERNIKGTSSAPKLVTPRDNLRPPTSTTHIRATHRYTSIGNGVDNVNM